MYIIYIMETEIEGDTFTCRNKVRSRHNQDRKTERKEGKFTTAICVHTHACTCRYKEFICLFVCLFNR